MNLKGRCAALKVISFIRKYSNFVFFFRDCEDFNVLGFDCEWIPNDGPVALLQLATARGNMYLIRTCKMKQMPEDLRVRNIYIYTYIDSCVH